MMSSNSFRRRIDALSTSCGRPSRFKVRGKRSVVGGVDVSASPGEAKLVGGIILFLSITFSLTFWLCCAWVHFDLDFPNWLGMVPLPTFVLTHLILIIGECSMIREVWKSGLSMLLMWGSLGLYIFGGIFVKLVS